MVLAARCRQIDDNLTQESIASLRLQATRFARVKVSLAGWLASGKLEALGKLSQL